jgi:hypothetical protein
MNACSASVAGGAISRSYPASCRLSQNQRAKRRRHAIFCKLWCPIVSAWIFCRVGAAWIYRPIRLMAASATARHIDP